MRKSLRWLVLILIIVQKCLHGTEVIVAEKGLASGRLSLRPMIHEIGLLWKGWDWSAWIWSTGMFLFLVLLNYIPRFSGVLWLAFAPVLSGCMILLASRSLWPKKRPPFGLFRWGVRCVVVNYTVMAWFFFYLITGAAVSLLFAGALDWLLVRIPFKRAWSFSLLHLAWILPMFFLLGVIGKSLRFYFGAFFALPLVAIRDGGILHSLHASRAACRGSLRYVVCWMALGWLTSFLPVLVYLLGGGWIIAWMTNVLPGTFASLWKIYLSCSALFLVCFVMVLLAWPLGFFIQVAAYRRIWSVRG